MPVSYFWIFLSKTFNLNIICISALIPSCVPSPPQAKRKRKYTASPARIRALYISVAWFVAMPWRWARDASLAAALAVWLSVAVTLKLCVGSLNSPLSPGRPLFVCAAVPVQWPERRGGSMCFSVKNSFIDPVKHPHTHTDTHAWRALRAWLAAVLEALWLCSHSPSAFFIIVLMTILSALIRLSNHRTNDYYAWITFLN